MVYSQGIWPQFSEFPQPFHENDHASHAVVAIELADRRWVLYDPTDAQVSYDKPRSLTDPIGRVIRGPEPLDSIVEGGLVIKGLADPYDTTVDVAQWAGAPAWDTFTDPQGAAENLLPQLADAVFQSQTMAHADGALLAVGGCALRC